MRRLLLALALFAAPLAHAQKITVTFPAARSATPLDGRVLFLLSNDPSSEPRMQIDDTPRSQQVFGVTVDGLKPGEPVILGSTASGYPIRTLADLPPGDYTVQAVLNLYETFHRGDGKTVKLAPDRGEGQHWNLAPGNLYSTPKKVRIGAGAPAIAVELDNVIGPISPEPDTKIRPPSPHPERLADEVLGPPHVPLRHRPRPRRLRRAPRRALPPRNLPRPLSRGLR